MTTTRSTLLFGGNISNTSFTAFTCPANSVTLIKEVVYFDGSGAFRVLLQWHTSAGSERCRLIDETIPIQTTKQWNFWQVMNSGDVLLPMAVSGAGTSTMAISGAVLALA